MTEAKRARATKAEFAARVKVLQACGHLFSKRSDLVKYAQNQFNCSSVQARTYVREAFPDGVLTAVHIQEDYLEFSRKINYYLAKASMYITSETELNQMLRNQFQFSQEKAAEYIGEFKKSKHEWENRNKFFNKDSRDEAYRLVAQKLRNKEWPKVGLFKCTDCETQAEHYHHPNYAYPLWVEPVCQACHTRIHTILAQRLLD